jgi:hypothetical protein
MSIRWVVAAGAALGLAGIASARPPATFHDEAGDAGELPGSAQSTNGAGTLNFINGYISGAADVDMYCIYIKDPAKFSATTASDQDPQLFLFKHNGVGVVSDDDGAPGPNGVQAFIDGRFVGAPGEYLLAISDFNREPLDGGGNPIFADFFVNYTNPALSNNPIASWNNGSEVGGNYDYQIRLTGVEFANCDIIPLPTAGLMGLAGLGAAGMIRRRND